jgi:maleylpyruvate isomerase
VIADSSLSFEISECHQAHIRLLQAASGLGDSEVRAPSRLPGWTRGHLLTHLARQGDSVVRRLVAAIDGRAVPQYEGGSETRNREIEFGARRSAGELIEDLRHSALAVDEVFASLPANAWMQPVRSTDGPERPASTLVFLRWQEVDIHHVDLALNFDVEDWPETLVARMLPETIDGLAARADRHELLGWLIGRSALPTLAPWD